MKILYLSASWLPSRKANAVHVVKMAAALAAAGHDVTLVVKSANDRRDRRPRDHADYGVPADFDIVKLARPRIRGGELVYWARTLRLLLTFPRPALVYCRYLPGALTAALLGLNVIYETHGVRPGRLEHGLEKALFRCRSFRRLVLVSEQLRRDYERLGRLPSRADTVVAHDAVDPAAWDLGGEVDPTGPLADRSRRHLGYVGSLYQGRGLELVLDLARRFEDCFFHVVGGSSEELARLRERDLPSNLILHGFVKHAELPGYYRCFDALLMPYQSEVQVESGRLDISRWMSPMKMFEYMISGKPIVCADLPVLGEILQNGRNALLVPPGDADGFAQALKRLFDEPALGRRLAAQAQRDVLADHTWKARVRRVLPDSESGDDGRRHG